MILGGRQGLADALMVGASIAVVENRSKLSSWTFAKERRAAEASQPSVVLAPALWVISEESSDSSW